VIPLVFPDWPAPPNVRAFSTTREGGVSQSAWASLNLGEHSGDEPGRVAENRRRLQALLPSPPGWLRQVHGTRVVRREGLAETPAADGVVCSSPGLACTVLTADCLPVLFCDRAGNHVAVAHAGWRGLLGGVLQTTVAALAVPPDQLLAWLGPAIGPAAYQVGPEFRERFLAVRPAWSSAFARRQDGWHADLGAIARDILSQLGVGGVHGGHLCTYTERDRFYSHRRDGPTGRMATLIWLEP